MRETFCVAELVVCIFFVKLCALDALFYSVESGYVCADDTIARATVYAVALESIRLCHHTYLARAVLYASVTSISLHRPRKQMVPDVCGRR
uniref:Uncharacterized protein n=1 Tax=Hyaloperonospora arabidopsidis (strain Emoy2) TaxID=559515 RepID=M4BA59_HYAAE